MYGGESGATRRRYLAALSGTVCAGGLAGCGIISAGEGSSSLTAREPICAGASSAAAALYDDWFVRLRPSEVDRPTLAFSSADLSVLERFSGVSALAEPYLLYPLRIARRSALADRPLQRVTALRAPGEMRAASVAFQWPGNELDRQTWLSEFKLGFGSAGGGEFHISFEEHDGKFGYEQYNVADYPPARMEAYDDEHVLILPKADEAITADVETRFR